MTATRFLIAATTALALGLPAAQAQDLFGFPRPGDPPLRETPREAPSPFEEALESFAIDLFGRFEPYMRGMAEEAGRSFNEYRPALENLSRLMDDIGNYQMPERLPNGDILIRRNPDAPPPPALDDLPDGEGLRRGFPFNMPRPDAAPETGNETTEL